MREIWLFHIVWEFVEFLNFIVIIIIRFGENNVFGQIGLYTYLLGYLLIVVTKQLSLLYGRVADFTVVVNSLSPNMR